MKMLWPDNPITALCLKLGATVCGMFVFAVWVMPPLYDAFCDITGLNGKTGGRYEAVDTVINTDREITVQFVATNNAGMPWRFGPEDKVVKVHPGEQMRINYLATNTTGKDMVAQAIPSLVPYKASGYFHKTECFCFDQQWLAAGDSAVLPMIFIVDQDLPDHINTITLSYTLFDVTDRFTDEQIMSMAQNGQ